MKEELSLGGLILILAGMLYFGFGMLTIAAVGLGLTGVMAAYGKFVGGKNFTKHGIKRRIVQEGIALRRTAWFHETNSDLEKLLALALFATWSVITIGVAFGYAEATQQYAIITALMWMMIGKMWGGAMKDVSSGAG